MIRSGSCFFQILDITGRGTGAVPTPLTPDTKSRPQPPHRVVLLFYFMVITQGSLTILLSGHHIGEFYCFTLRPPHRRVLLFYFMVTAQGNFTVLLYFRAAKTRLCGYESNPALRILIQNQVHYPP